MKDGRILQIGGFVSDAHLADWRARILRNQHQWRSCFDRDFWTYGGAWYVDIEEGAPARYHAEAMVWNRRLRQFPGLRQSVKRIAALLPRHVPAVPRRAILGPYWTDYGFAVYDRDGRSGVAHTDVEGLIPYPASMFDQNTEAYSATISIDCPAAGGGLWIHARRHIGHYHGATSRKGWTLHGYQPGTLTVFDSFLPHSIERFALSNTCPRRTVLVVHFLYRKKPYPHYQYWV